MKTLFFNRGEFYIIFFLPCILVSIPLSSENFIVKEYYLMLANLLLMTYFTYCYGLNAWAPQNSYVEMLTPNVMALGGRASGRWSISNLKFRLTGDLLLPSSFLFPPCGIGMSISYLSHQSILAAYNMLVSQVHSWRVISLRMNCTLGLIHTWFSWYLDETLDFKVDNGTS